MQMTQTVIDDAKRRVEERRAAQRLPTLKDFIRAWENLTLVQQARVCMKSNWEHMTRWAVMNEWGLDWGSPEPEEGDEFLIEHMKKREAELEQRAKYELSKRLSDRQMLEKARRARNWLVDCGRPVPFDLRHIISEMNTRQRERRYAKAQ